MRWLGVGRQSTPGPVKPAGRRTALTVSLWVGDRCIGHEFYGWESVPERGPAPAKEETL